MPTIGSRQDLVPPQEKNTREITAFAVNLSLRSLTFPPPKPRVDPQWEDTENKSAVITYVAGGAALVWLSGTVVGAISRADARGRAWGSRAGGKGGLSKRSPTARVTLSSISLSLAP